MVIPGSDRFVLRQFTLADARGYFECHDDPDAKRNFMRTPNTLEEAEGIVQRIAEEYTNTTPHNEYFAIEIDGSFAGYVGIENLNEEHFAHRATINFALHPSFRGQGIMTDAARLITEYAFETYGLVRLQGFCRTFNTASARVLEKVGFELEGVLRKNKCRDGEFLDDMVWAIVR